MKKILIPSLFLLLASCSGSEKEQFTSITIDSIETPCDCVGAMKQEIYAKQEKLTELTELFESSMDIKPNDTASWNPKLRDVMRFEKEFSEKVSDVHRRCTGNMAADLCSSYWELEKLRNENKKFNKTMEKRIRDWKVSYAKKHNIEVYEINF